MPDSLGGGLTVPSWVRALGGWLHCDATWTPEGGAACLPAHRDGFLLLDRDKLHASFADLPAEHAAFMDDAQVPWGVDALSGSITDPARRTKPSWYLSPPRIG